MKREISIETFDGTKWRKAGSVILSENGIIQFIGMNKRSIREMNTYGCCGNGRDGPRYPRDGEKFLDALVEETGRCSRVRALRSR